MFTPTGKPHGLLEGLFSPAKDDVTPRNNSTVNKVAETSTQQAKEPIRAENIIPRGLGLGLEREGDIVTPTQHGMHKRKLGKEECLQLGLELRKVLEGDQECMSLLKSSEFGYPCSRSISDRNIILKIMRHSYRYV